MVEIGCFDGRLLEFCPRKPKMYEGFDADWEGGLSAALEKFKGHPSWKFHAARDPREMSNLEGKSFHVAAALETMEHIPVDLVDPYLRELSRVTSGHLIVTVPNEKGMVFLTKYLYKRAFHGSTEPYEVSEVFQASIGNMKKVRRGEHKGFDYAELVKQIQEHFDVIRVEGIPFGPAPSLSFTVGIIAKSR